ncbi:golgin subfamily A member 6-like protein 22 [Macrobrachium rosenbergii]|uniref:golgin subfamily A member 6-like protein 22 n=1 Tax=Macrobrachium rosenbergii TaxID=79674 RepID=UPI0034D63D12
MTLLLLNICIGTFMALVRLVGSVITTCYKFGVHSGKVSRNDTNELGTVKIDVMQVPTEGSQERSGTADDVSSRLKNALEDKFATNQEIPDRNLKPIELERVIRQRAEELEELFVQQELNHCNQLVALREEADAHAKVAEDQAMKLEALQTKYDNVNQAMGIRVIEINLLKADIARKALKLASDEKEMLALEEKANNVEAENSRLLKIISDYEARLKGPQEDEEALQERDTVQMKRGLDDDSRENTLLQSQVEALKLRVSKQEEQQQDDDETKQERGKGRKPEGRTEYDKVMEEIRRLREGQEALQKEMRKEQKRNEKMEQQLQNLLRKVEEKPSDQHTREFARAEDRTKEVEVMSGRREGKERKTPTLARRSRPKRWKPKERSLWSSVLKFAAQKRKVKERTMEAQHLMKKKKLDRPLNYYEDMPETQGLYEELHRQDEEHLHLRDKISVARVRNELLQEQLDAEKAENMQLKNRITQMEGGFKMDNESVENLRQELGKANCIVAQKNKEVDKLQQKLEEMNFVIEKREKIHGEQADELLQCQREKAELEEQVQGLQQENVKLQKEGEVRKCELQRKNRQLHSMQQVLRAKENELKRKVDEDPEKRGLMDSLRCQLQSAHRERDQLAHQVEELLLKYRHQMVGLRKYAEMIEILLASQGHIKEAFERQDFNLIVTNFK